MGWMGCDETYTAKGTSQLSHFRACSGSNERFSPSISRELSPVPIAIGSACYVWATPTQTTSLHDADLGDGPGDSRGAWRSTNRAARDGAVAVPTEKKKTTCYRAPPSWAHPALAAPHGSSPLGFSWHAIPKAFRIRVATGHVEHRSLWSRGGPTPVKHVKEWALSRMIPALSSPVYTFTEQKQRQSPSFALSSHIA